MTAPVPPTLLAAGPGVAAEPVVLAWYGCDLRTGQIIEDLPSLKPTGPLSRRLGTSTSTSFELALGGAPAGWEAATDQGRTLLVAVDTVTDRPVWSGIVLTREGGTAQTVTLGAATPEAYLDRRYTGDQVLIQQDQAAVLASLMGAALTQGPPLVMDAPATGTLMDFTVLDGDDRTTLSAAQEVMGLEGGPEWTIDTEWEDASHTGFVLPVRVRPKIGAQSPAPEATFDAPGCVTSYTLAESYESGKGATVVLARGEGEGESRLSSAPRIATDLEATGWPRYVHRFTPATGITDPDQLTAHAAQALALMATGARVWTVEAVASRAPRLGRDWGLGDTVRIAVEHSPRHPEGAEAVARAWSWELDPGADRVRPILIEED
ncbi:siphovirus ReqiPepy6 Gp37-like family protein [Streptomyces sp. GMY02]|uniref:siphovirus ReqiPepy6 Gp37-like family protein n=1 Tax=Streptomyces sp. GMY02 TaxID=1333528 RepID=UPI001C2C26F6|nr:siphovirus ReqiPepy6 Gp37-like family protein [Streptomyces sp. GMY02]QXE36216.1 siphovirus ReqiPepy6 Gp37-like family protein [Streptomyces sp. GMY02]